MQWYSLEDNLVLSTGLIMRIGHHKEIRKLTIRVLALRQNESRNCGLCVVCIQVKCSVILVDWFGPNNFSTLQMKGHVLHHARAHLSLKNL